MLSNLKSALFPVHDSGANLRIVQFIGRLDEKKKKNSSILVLRFCWTPDIVQGAQLIMLRTSLISKSFQI